MFKVIVCPWFVSDTCPFCAFVNVPHTTDPEFCTAKTVVPVGGEPKKSNKLKKIARTRKVTAKSASHREISNWLVA